MTEYKMAGGFFTFWVTQHEEGAWAYIFRVPKGHSPDAWVPVMHAANSSTTFRPLPYRPATAEDVELWFKANPKCRVGRVA